MIGDIHKYCHLLLQEIPVSEFIDCEHCYFGVTDEVFCSRPVDFPFCSSDFRQDGVDVIFVNVGEYD